MTRRSSSSARGFAETNAESHCHNRRPLRYTQARDGSLSSLTWRPANRSYQLEGSAPPSPTPAGRPGTVTARSKTAPPTPYHCRLIRRPHSRCHPVYVTPHAATLLEPNHLRPVLPRYPTTPRRPTHASPCYHPVHAPLPPDCLDAPRPPSPTRTGRTGDHLSAGVVKPEPRWAKIDTIKTRG